jgi:hypothetical protein
MSVNQSNHDLFAYNFPPRRQEDVLYDKAKATWKPPFRDALDVILDNLAGIAVRYAKTGAARPPIQQFFFL